MAILASGLTNNRDTRGLYYRYDVATTITASTGSSDEIL
jgi:hypothetical protein